MIWIIAEVLWSDTIWHEQFQMPKQVVAYVSHKLYILYYCI